VTSNCDRPDGSPQASAPRVRVAAVDDDTLIREGLQTLLCGIEVIATYPDVEHLLQERPKVDVVLLDLDLTGTGRHGALQGGRAVSAVAGIGYRVLIYTNERRREVLLACLANGAHGVLHKAEPLSEVEKAINVIAEGHIVITTALTGLAELVQHRGDLPGLSPRQIEILAGRARGEQYKSIAARLYITPRTAEDHMHEVNRKFAHYLRDHSVADLERRLGLAPGDLLDPRTPTG
jgi:DNA-binding NarL/FixJ family response regulator